MAEFVNDPEGLDLQLVTFLVYLHPLLHQWKETWEVKFPSEKSIEKSIYTVALKESVTSSCDVTQLILDYLDLS